MELGQLYEGSALAGLHMSRMDFAHLIAFHEARTGQTVISFAELDAPAGDVPPELLEATPDNADARRRFVLGA